MIRNVNIMHNQLLVPVPSRREGTQVPDGGTTQERVPPARDGVPPGQDGIHRTSRPPPDRAADGVLATQRAVCLLRSRRRTVLLDY